MTTTIVILILVFIIAYAINKSKKKTGQENNSFDSNRPIKLNVSFPDPEKANDYKFFKFRRYIKSTSC